MLAITIVLQPRIGLNTIALVVRKLKELNADHPLWKNNPLNLDMMPYPGVKPTEVRIEHSGLTDKPIWLECLKLVREIQNIVDPDCFSPEQLAEGAKALQQLEKEIAEEQTKQQGVESHVAH